MSTQRVAIGRAEITQLSCLGIIDTEAFRIGRNIDITSIVASHIAKLVAIEGNLSLTTACRGIVSIERIISSHPITLLFVTVDELRIRRAGRFGYNTSLTVEAINAIALHVHPDNTAVTLT